MSYSTLASHAHSLISIVFLIILTLILFVYYLCMRQYAIILSAMGSRAGLCGIVFWLYHLLPRDLGKIFICFSFPFSKMWMIILLLTRTIGKSIKPVPQVLHVHVLCSMNVEGGREWRICFSQADSWLLRRKDGSPQVKARLWKTAPSNLDLCAYLKYPLHMK